MTIREQPIGEFLDAVASGHVTPSGGAVAAVAGAMGAALCEMGCVHTHKGGESAGSALSDVQETVATRRARLLGLADEDVLAVEEVQAAFQSGDPARIQTAAEHSTEIPLETAETCLDVVESAATVTANGTPVAVPDAAVGALLAHAALEASVSTVRANLEMIDDQTFVAEMEQWSTEAEVAGERAIERVLDTLTH